MLVNALHDGLQDVDAYVVSIGMFCGFCFWVGVLVRTPVLPVNVIMGSFTFENYLNTNWSFHLN